MSNGLGELFFLNGPGGTGKTYVYKTVISKLRSSKNIVLPVALSGIAALLLPGGMTAHSRFKLPLTLTGDSMCDIKPGTMLGELLLKTDLIIWDEAPMSHCHAFEALDRSLKDLVSTQDSSAGGRFFGGKTVLLGGNFRKILPVIPQGTRAYTVLTCISKSYLWGTCTVYTLEKNMRVEESEIDFAKWLITVGDGTTPERESKVGVEGSGDQFVVIEKRFCIE